MFRGRWSTTLAQACREALIWSDHPNLLFSATRLLRTNLVENPLTIQSMLYGAFLISLNGTV